MAPPAKALLWMIPVILLLSVSLPVKSDEPVAEPAAGPPADSGEAEGPSNPTVKDLKDKLGASEELKCFVCNSAVDGTYCKRTSKSEGAIDCKTEYMEKVYGSAALGDSVDLKKFPEGLSELPDTATELGWMMGKLKPSASSPPPPSADSYRFSGWDSLYQANKVQKGFRSCLLQKISVEPQQNAGRGFEISHDDPRIIRGCSVAAPTSECEVKKIPGGEITTCLCGSNNCNSSSNLRVSHWMFFAFILVILAQLLMK